jgi:outer membrane protein insertion porin family
MIAVCLDRRIYWALAALAGIAFVWTNVGLAADNPNGKIISTVIPIGNHIRKTEDILALIQCRPGTVYDAAKAQEDIRRLQGTKWFIPGSIQINTFNEADGRVQVIVRLVELMSTVEDIQFLGAQHLGKSDLTSLAGIKKGDSMNPPANRIGQSNILKKYQEEEGRTYATVELVEGNFSTDTR